MQFIEQVLARCGLSALLFTLGCQDVGGLLVENHGKQPRADARVIGQAGKMVTLAFAGKPVEVTLDGSQSSDPDGHIASYRWLAWTGKQPETDGGVDGGVDGGTVWSPAIPDGGVLADGGTGPDGGSAGWPDDVTQPTVTLAEGSYVFTLWVIDDRGNTSLPDSVRIDVQASLSPEATAQCVDSALDGTDPVCVECMCRLGDACRDAVSASKCDAGCWALIACIGEKCPDPDPQTRMACVPANCGTFLPPAAPAAALEGARGLGEMGANCFRAPCDEACRSSMP